MEHLTFDSSGQHRGGHRSHNRIIIFGVIAAVAIAGALGVQAVQATQGAAEQAQAQAAAQSQARAATASQQAQAVESATMALKDVIEVAEPEAAAAAAKFSPYRLTDAISSAKTLIALQKEDPEALNAAAASVKEAQDWLKAELVRFDVDKAAEAKRAAADAAKKAKADAARIIRSTPPQPSVSTERSTPRTVTRVVKASDKPVWANSAALLAGAQAVLDKLGGGVRVSLAHDFKLFPGCSAHATLGAPVVVIRYCYLDMTREGMYDLMAHEWVHTQTPKNAVFPWDLAPKGVNASEMVADCYAMAKLHTTSSPGGYMDSCTAAQTAAAIAVVEHPIYQ